MGGTLDGKIALSTDGTGGIGAAICRRLSAMGARDDAAFITGANLAANGGQHLH